MLRNRLATTFAAVGFLFAIGNARADIANLTLTTGNTSGTPSLSGFSGPFAEVQINRTSSTTATITFTSDISTSGNASCTGATPCTYKMGDGGTVGVNVNAGSWTITSITGNGGGTLSDGGSGNEDGWGSFNQTVNTSDGFTDSNTSVSFVLTNTSGTWANAASVLTNNSDSHEAAAHIFVSSAACTGACTTGFATDGGGGTQSSVPEPTTIGLLGAVLAVSVRGIRQKFASR
jgi:hypothetical protein